MLMGNCTDLEVGCCDLLKESKQCRAIVATITVVFLSSSHASHSTSAERTHWRTSKLWWDRLFYMA